LRVLNEDSIPLCDCDLEVFCRALIPISLSVVVFFKASALYLKFKK
jgi:hypothetical protein